jgi:hypothetical protein
MNPITLFLSVAFVLAGAAAGQWISIYLAPPLIIIGILVGLEAAIAANFVEAVRVYENQPGALQLRAMNIIYETTKERGATIPMPTSMVDSLNPALALAIAGRDPATGEVVSPLKTAA